jgi:hypothetical protein
MSRWPHAARVLSLVPIPIHNPEVLTLLGDHVVFPAVQDRALIREKIIIVSGAVLVSTGLRITIIKGSSNYQVPTGRTNVHWH